MMKISRSIFWRYGLNLLAVVALLLISILLRRFNLTINLTWLLVAVLLVAGWYGGRGPGIMAACLLEVAINYFSPPQFQFKFTFAAINRLGLMILLALMASSRRKAEQKLQVKARQQAAIAQLGQQALAQAPLSLLIEEAALLVTQHIEAEYSSIWERMPDEKTLQAQAGVGWKENMIDHATVLADTATQIGQTFLSHKPLLITDYSQEAYFTLPPLLREHQVVSGISVLIPGKNQPYGVLCVHSTKRRKFTTDDLNFLQAIANVLAEAIARHRAETEIRKLNDELEQRVIERTSQLEAANKELEAFSYSISHDLRAPLRAISGFSRILLNDFSGKLPHEAQDHLQLVGDNAKQMGQLIDDLLNFSRLSKQPLTKQVVAPSDIARRVLTELQIEQQGARVLVSMNDLPTCQADPTLLKQVFVNLLTNALKFTSTREQAVIEIGCCPETEPFGYLIYYVKDNGAGFDMRYVHKLFQVFQRLHRAEDYEGTGVGLAIVQRIINRHGGRVWAEAKLNQGATFYFTLAGENRDYQYQTSPVEWG